MPDENRVFDVSKPSKVSPSPTSRPVIVGHHPMNDPMVREENNFGTENPGPATKINVTDGAGAGSDDLTVGQAMTNHQAAESSAKPSEEPSQGSPAIFSDHNEESDRAHESVGQGPFTDVEPDHTASPPSDLPPAAPPSEPHIEGLNLAEPRQKGDHLKWWLTGGLALLVAGYLLIDAGVISSGLNLPFHIFKQKQETASTASPTPSKPADTTPALPAGFKKYKLADTKISFAAPEAWGEPTSTTDPGYTTRGGSNQPDGTFAYLVNFADNKDIQIAVTSSKFLPATRTLLYYDYLQWCIGSNDDKIYQSVLNFSTSNKVDTPTTVTCNQGPINATSVNTTTIVQLKATDVAAKVIGDIYAMNLKDPSLVVMRVKDIAMTHSDDIKKLLGTVQIATGTSGSTP